MTELVEERRDIVVRDCGRQRWSGVREVTDHAGDRELEVQERKRETYGAVVVQERRTLNVLATGVRVFAFTRIQIEEEQALKISTACIHRVALHFAEPFIFVLDSTSNSPITPTP